MTLRLALLCGLTLSSLAFADQRNRWRHSPPPAPPPAPRDCGTGYDPGCETWRNGHLPMDAGAFAGLLASLDSTPFEYDRLERLKAVMTSSALTSAQLGRVLERFVHEYLRLDAAKAVAPNLVDPWNAWGLSSRFVHFFIGQDFTKLIAEQQ